MKIILFTHPSFMQSQSMPRYAKMLWDYFNTKGYEIACWSPKPFFYKMGFNGVSKKWLGYIDQYILFPVIVYVRLLKCDANTLFVFADQAMGPWVPLVSKRNHVVHCHDFLALRSALGEIVENPTSYSGRLYQAFIRKGFSKGKNFISVSKQTQKELHTYYLGAKMGLSEVVYNGLNQVFKRLDQAACIREMETFLNKKMPNGYILHVGGNDWYKNKAGAIKLYSKWRSKYNMDIPLVLLGNKPEGNILDAIEQSAYKTSIYLALNVPNELLNKAYSGALFLLFPSLAEGFGWPIAEAMASGTLVLTTNAAPMNEVGGDVAYYIEAMPHDEEKQEAWLLESSKKVHDLLNISSGERVIKINAGLEFVQLFSTEKCLRSIETIYADILKK